MSAIELHEIGVRFPRQRNRNLREWAALLASGGPRSDEHDALSGISLNVARGEALGIIGGNGSGKSTLLRVIAGILTPSFGYAVTRGAIAPIIELGTGFDMDLTGRENIFFNAALLGRSRGQVRTTIDEIVEFASLGEFIDQPLRTFSTGMRARLAFSIATRVEAEIILLDEILAAGDESFRERSGERIVSFYGRGATVVLVSHDMATVERLCHRVVWLRNGVIAASGEAGTVVQRYQSEIAGDPSRRADGPE